MSLLKTGVILGFVIAVNFSSGATDIIMTYGSPGATDSTLANATVFNFDSLQLGVQNNVAWPALALLTHCQSSPLINTVGGCGCRIPERLALCGSVYECRFGRRFCHHPQPDNSRFLFRHVVVGG